MKIFKFKKIFKFSLLSVAWHATVFTTCTFHSFIRYPFYEMLINDSHFSATNREVMYSSVNIFINRKDARGFWILIICGKRT